MHFVSACACGADREVECSGDLFYTHSNHTPSLTEAVWLPCTSFYKKKADKCFPLPSQWSSLLQRIVFISESHYGLRIFLYIFPVIPSQQVLFLRFRPSQLWGLGFPCTFPLQTWNLFVGKEVFRKQNLSSGIDHCYWYVRAFRPFRWQSRKSIWTIVSSRWCWLHNSVYLMPPERHALKWAKW